MYREHWEHGWAAWQWILMIVIGATFWAGLIAVVASLRRRPTGVTGPTAGFVAPPHRVSAEDLLAERFARGDIDADEFRHRLEVLRAHHYSPSGPSSADPG